MTEEQFERLDHYLQDLELPFQFPVVVALIREALAGEGEPADTIARRIYEIAGAILPGEDDPLLFEQLIFDLYKEVKGSFDKEEDETLFPMRGRILDLIDKWMQLSDILNEEEKFLQDGNHEIRTEMEELLSFLQSLLNRLNHPEEESPDSAGELSFLLDQSEDVFKRIVKQGQDLLNPQHPVTEMAEGEKTLVLRVELKDADIPIWRTLRVSGSVNLEQFHLILQKVMGWWDLYDHSFEQAGSFWGISAGEDDGIIYQDEAECFLQSLLQEEDDMLHYRYDLPEGWHHQVRVEEVLEDRGAAPLCLDGEGAGPPEDCGGPEGFRMLLASLKPGASEELKEDFSWVGDYDPQRFDKESVNKELGHLI